MFRIVSTSRLSAIETEGVSKRFRIVHSRNSTLKATIFNGFRRTVHEEFWALEDVSFSVPQGSTFGLIGHNGSGKSTLLKCLAKIYRPDRGQIRTTGVLSALLELGAGFHPELSGRENVYLNASILGLGRREVDRRFDDIVSFAGLERFIDSPIKNYSSGMFVRLGFAVAINIEPDVLLVDEVLAVGDEEFQQRCLGKFAQLRASGRTVVIVSHGLEMVRKLCDQVAWLDHGHLAGCGDTDEIVSAYLTSVRGAPVGSVEHESGWTIDSLGLLDPGGAAVSEARSGEAVTIQCAVSAERPAEMALVLELRRPDSLLVGSSRHDVQLAAGRTELAYHLDALQLGAGDYHLVVRLIDTEGIERAISPPGCRFLVADEYSLRDGSLLALRGRWENGSGAAAKPRRSRNRRPPRADT